VALIILHTGQSGVERGADCAARILNVPVAGFCTFERRDELGALPEPIARDLTPCAQRGARSAQRDTLATASAVLLIVPDVKRVSSYPGITMLRALARKTGTPHWVVDPIVDRAALVTELRALARDTSPLRLMVTGPRMTRWQEGMHSGRELVADLWCATS
jgi:hypothetical protein